jgi:uncharacterized protein with PIN domain
MDQTNDICFTAEATLGKLAKWLRILGFDTLYSPDVLRKERINDRKKNRILLTRTARNRNRDTLQPLVFITSNNPFEQLEEVVKELDLVASDIKPFSRCIRCNTRINQVDKDAVYGKVPDYIWQTHDKFQTCRQCRRIYWAGSHTRQSFEIIRQLFD